MQWHLHRAAVHGALLPDALFPDAAETKPMARIVKPDIPGYPKWVKSRGSYKTFWVSVHPTRDQVRHGASGLSRTAFQTLVKGRMSLQ